MTSLPLGIFLAIGVIAFGLAGNADNTVYFNPHSMIIVVCGTFAVLLFGTPSKVIRYIFRDVIALFRTEPTIADLSGDLRALVKSRSLPSRSRDHLLNRASGLWESGVSPELFMTLLNQAKVELDYESAESIQALRNLSKYPPALGMMGTVMGLISLFSHLNQDSRSSLGPSLALAMTATFFGLIITNLVITPLADRLQMRQIQRRIHLTHLFQILTLIHQGEASSLVEEVARDHGGKLATA